MPADPVLRALALAEVDDEPVSDRERAAIASSDPASRVDGRPGRALMTTQQTERLSVGYLASVIATTVVVPLIAFGATGADPSTLPRWFVFSAVGLRLLIAGVRQAVQPSFTAREIFNLQSPDALVIVRELGFANVCLGLTGVISAFAPAWRPAATFAGGLYFGIAGVMHAVKGSASPNERVALVSDLAIFAVCALLFFGA